MGISVCLTSGRLGLAAASLCIISATSCTSCPLYRLSAGMLGTVPCTIWYIRAMKLSPLNARLQQQASIRCVPQQSGYTKAAWPKPCVLLRNQ